ncbi:MAG: outer membrane porin, OprD family [Epsilonproteobacteria bacterium]|nr:outer membrane porin, OprD family [Campylobacterota bacterium]
MKKMTILSVVLLSSTSFVFGANNLVEAFEEGKFENRIRYQNFHTDWEDNTATGKNGEDGFGMAIGGSVVYKTAPLHGISFGAGAYTTQNLFNATDIEDGKTATTSKDLFNRDGTTLYGEGYTTFAQLYMGYDFSKTKTKVGRFLMTNPWTTPNDTKMIPIAIEGGQIISGELKNTTIQFDYMNNIKERGMRDFHDMATTGDTPDKIKTAYLTKESPSVYVLDIKNHSIDSVELKASGMYWEDLVAQAMFEANWAFELGDDTIVGIGGRYLKQFDKGAGDIIKPKTNNYDSDNSIDSSLVMARATLNYGKAKLLVSGSKTSENADIISPWRGFPTDGYTRSMTQTDWNAGTKAYKVGLDYDLESLNDGFSSVLSYSSYDRDERKKPYQSMTNRAFQNGDTTQWNLDLTQKLSDKFKGVELKARFMNQHNEKTTLATKETSNTEMRLEANYRF